MKYKYTPYEAECPVCGNTHAEILYELTSKEAAQWFFLEEREPDRYKNIERVIRRLWDGKQTAFVRCKNCSFCFADPYIAGDSEFYSSLYETPRYPEWKWEFELTYISLKEKIQNGELSQPFLLEIGAGDGAFVRRAAENLFNKDHLLTLEYSQYGKNKIEESGIECLAKDVREIDLAKYKQHFDVICMFQVLEHLDNLNSLFKRFNEITTDSALLYIAVPSDIRVEFNEKYDAVGDMAPCHVGRWNEQSFDMIARQFGWQLKELKREPESKIWRFLEFSLQRYAQHTKTHGSIFNKAESVQNRFLRYLCQIPLICLMALRSIPLLGQLMRDDLGKSQWVILQKNPVK